MASTSIAQRSSERAFRFFAKTGCPSAVILLKSCFESFELLACIPGLHDCCMRLITLLGMCADVMICNVVVCEAVLVFEKFHFCPACINGTWSV